MTRLLFHTSEQSIPTEPDDQIHVLLYGSSPPHPHVGVVGNKVLDIASRLVVRPSTAAMDFLAIAMAVTAADTFVSRDAAADRCLIRGGAVERWVLQAGPLPEDMADRQLYFNVARRGIAELASYLSAEGFKS